MTPGLLPGAEVPAAAGFDFDALLAALLDGALAPEGDVSAQGEAPSDGTASETETETEAAAVAGALAAAAQAAPVAVAAAAGGAAAPAATFAKGEPATGQPGAAPANVAGVARVAVDAATPAPSAVPSPSTSEGGTLGSRAAAGVVVKEESGVQDPLLDEAADTGKGAASSAPSDLPSKSAVAGSTPAPATMPAAVAPDATVPVADGAAAALSEAAHPKADATANGGAPDRSTATTTLGTSDAAALQTAHAGTHRDASGDGHREGGTPAGADVAPPAPPTVPFQAPLRDAAHADATRLEPTALRAPEPPEPPRAAPRSEMRLEVASDDLGKVEVRVVVRADGVHATLLAPHDQAREVLSQHRASLEQALGRAQLRLDGFTVGAGPDDGRHQHERFDRSGLPTATQAGTPIGLAAVPVPASTTSELPLGKGLSLRA